MHIAGVVLAAGGANRMGTDKRALLYEGRPLFYRALEPFTACPLVDEVIAVVNPDFNLPVSEPKCRIVVNPEYQRGMSSSLRAGIAGASDAAEAYLIGLGDMPRITTDLVVTLIRAFQRSDKTILVPVFEGRHGHPVLFDRRWKEALMRIQGDIGAREILNEHSQMVEYLPVEDPAVLFDVDAAEDLRDD